MNLLNFFSFSYLEGEVKMKKIALVLCAFVCLTSTAMAHPNMKHGGHHGPKHRPNKVHIHHMPPRHHHGHIIRSYCPYRCHSPYCVHRGFMNTFFQLAPGFSIGISI